MNAINRIELAIRRAASQMPDRDAALFKLLADELQLAVHACAMDEDLELRKLENYRSQQS